MRDLVRRVLPIAAHPPQLPFSQGIKEAEAEIAQIEEQQTPHRESLQKVEHIHSAVLLHRLAPFQPQPALSTQIQEAYQFESCAGWIMCAQAPPGLEIPAHRVESGFIQTENLRSKGGERCGYRPGSGKGQPHIDSLPHFL